MTARGGLYDIRKPRIRTVQPAVPNGASVLIACGGGYRYLNVRWEAESAARWFSQRGFTAFILFYRLPDEGWAAGPMAPLQDAMRAIRLIRLAAMGTDVIGLGSDGKGARLPLDPHRVGVVGFSAGGHLAGMLAANPFEHAYHALDSADQVDPRPDFAVLGYPVVTLMPPYDHTSTRRHLVGAHPTVEESKLWSVESHVDRRFPPVFMVQAQDDDVVSPENTEILRKACDAHRVPAERVLLTSGGHGFAMGRKGTASAHWAEARLEPWLKMWALPSSPPPGGPRGPGEHEKG